MANPSQTIHVVHEIEGGSLQRGFTEEADANNWFNHECAAGNLQERWYTVSPLVVENFGQAPKLGPAILDSVLDTKVIVRRFVPGESDVVLERTITDFFDQPHRARAVTAMIIEAYENARRGKDKLLDLDKIHQGVNNEL